MIFRKKYHQSVARSVVNHFNAACLHGTELKVMTTLGAASSTDIVMRLCTRCNRFEGKGMGSHFDSRYLVGTVRAKSNMQADVKSVFSPTCSHLVERV